LATSRTVAESTTGAKSGYGRVSPLLTTLCRRPVQTAAARLGESERPPLPAAYLRL